MRLNDYGKALLLLSILVTAAVLAALGVLEATDVRMVMVAELGYLTGNGVVAVRKGNQSPVVTHRAQPGPELEA